MYTTEYMTEEKLLPEGEPGIEVTALPMLKTPVSVSRPIEESEAKPATAAIPAGVPSAKAQSWGAVLSIIIIVLMIIIGAFYAWGKRITEGVPPIVPADSTVTQ